LVPQASNLRADNIARPFFCLDHAPDSERNPIENRSSICSIFGATLCQADNCIAEPRNLNNQQKGSLLSGY
jgi:hypothetical protein